MNESLRAMFSFPRQDAAAGIVVFLVALPLCLGIAVASGAPPVSGLVAGIVGGILVPFLSRSPLSVTGPAAGLVSIVVLETERLGGFERFLAATVAAGGIQVLLGLLRCGRLASLVPSSVIKGMLAAIGIVIVLKQLPVAAGATGGLDSIRTRAAAGPAVIAAATLAVLLGWRFTPLASVAALPAALAAVVMAAGLAALFRGVPWLALAPEHFVRVPLGGFGSLVDALPRPDFSALSVIDGWVVAGTVAAVAGIETLLSVQAVDRLDPLGRTSPPDRELLAQGVANAASGWMGGLPVTAVIVRSGANVAAGGRERMSALVHGALLLASVMFAGTALNMVPLACLAAILLQVGLVLARPALFRAQWRLGGEQFVPFAVTIAGVLAFDLLKGVLAGLAVGIAFAQVMPADGSRDHGDGLH